MNTFAKLVFFLFFALAVFTGGSAFAQVITINNVDPGPYVPGSTIGVPISIDDSGGCIKQGNTFYLYLSDATGNFAGLTLIGSNATFYASFLNGTIPAGTVPGVGYRVMIKSTNPGVSSTISAPFTIGVSGTAPISKIDAASINQTNPEVFGNCNYIAGYSFVFINSSTAGAKVDISFYNESTKTTDKTLTSVGANGSFTADATNYTVNVKATDALGFVSTKAYTLLNNKVNNSIGATGGGTNCISPTQAAHLLFNIDISSLNGIQYNYPGDIYQVIWGDGQASTYTFCELVASGGQISHDYTSSSCGNSPNGQKNAFQVNLQPKSPFCGDIGTQVTTYAQVIKSPKSSFTFRPYVCTNTEVVFTNTSDPGQDPNNTTGDCTNSTARYTWYVDGQPIVANKLLADQFKYTFTVNGQHTVWLEFQNNGSQCPIPIYKDVICVQDTPIPSFTLPAPTSCLGSVTPVNTSFIDQICNSTNSFTWQVTGPAAVGYANGTSVTSETPQFVFNTPGTYTIGLNITTASCGITIGPTQQIVINTPPSVSLSPDAQLCGNNQILNFSPTGTATKSILTGTSSPQPTTYSWTVTGGNYSFVNGTAANSQYPAIQFTDYATYTISVTHQNNCGSVTKSQQLTFRIAPKVDAGADQHICAGNSTTLSGTIPPVTGAPPVSNPQWIGGTGTFTPNRGTLNAVYAPSASEIANGQVTLILQGTSTAPAPCDKPSSSMTIFITPTDQVTSAATQKICTGTAISYQITASAANSTYSWTAAVTSGSATGFSASGTSSSISDVITNTDPTTDAVVTYTITPVSPDGCPGAPFKFNVTVTPDPIVTTSPANPVICTNQSTNIGLTSNLQITTYTWTATLKSGNVTGFSSQATPLSTNSIDDVLINNTTALGSVQYVITPISNNQCPGTPTTVIVTVQPSAVLSNPGPDDEVCNTTTYQFHGNDPSPGTGKWTETSGPPGTTFVDDTNPSTVVNGLIPGSVYTFAWTITATPTCKPSSKEMILVVDKATVGGTTAGAAVVCAGSNSGQITLNGYVGAITRWETSVDNGVTWSPIGGNTTATQSYFNLTQTTQYRAVVQSGVCTLQNSTATTITVNQPPIAAVVVQPPGPLCNQSTYALQGNDPGTFPGVWSLVTSTGQTATFANASQHNTTVSGLIGGQNYTFRWTIKATAPCTDSYQDVNIANLALVTNSISTTNPVICANQTVTVTGSAPTGGNGVYTYIWENSTDDVTWTAIPSETNKYITVTLQNTFYYRRKVTSGGCQTTSNEQQIVVQQALGNNTIQLVNREICFNTIPNLITGSTPTGGDGNYFYQWQSSTDGINFTDISGATAINYQSPALTATTQFRRNVNTTICSGTFSNSSNVITITVDPNAIAAYSFVKNRDCAPFFITSLNVTATDDPANGQYQWFANGVSIGTGLTFPGYTIQNDGLTVTITLKVISKYGCTDATVSYDFSTIKQVAAHIAADKRVGCGTVNVNFTNNSVPLNGANYTWSFGDGKPDYHGVTPPQHAFTEDPSGKDVVYIVTLTPDGCLPIADTVHITVYPASPVALIGPDDLSGCAPFTLHVNNFSPGTNSSYTYYLKDGPTLIQSITVNDKNPVQFNAVNPPGGKRYDLYMITQNKCSSTESRHFNIDVLPVSVSAGMAIAAPKKGCAPLTTTLTNLSSGGNTFYYSIFDSNKNLVGTVNTGTDDIPYLFPTKPDTYYVTITASNGCSTVTSPFTPANSVVVYPVPSPQFHADNTTGCKNFSVNFVNDTPDDPNSPATSNSYDWDFGDGSPHASTFTPPPHIYDYKNSPYTVTLTAKSTFGCSNTTTLANYIVVNPPPTADFTARPDLTTAIPNYHFSFVDLTKGSPIIWNWTFGDGSTSTRQNPEHTYADTGAYKVSLLTVDKNGCNDTISHIARITGVPGQLYVPNSFMPNSATTELHLFKAKGSGIKTWYMRIFNNYGQLIFETTKLTSKGEPAEGWDGTYKGVPMQQGVYPYEIGATFINGTEWKGMSYNNSAPRTAGVVHLIR